ncbi:serine protease [Leptolyngbyaceae cyanobacterium UHCC 1019]
MTPLQLSQGFFGIVLNGDGSFSWRIGQFTQVPDPEAQDPESAPPVDLCPTEQFYGQPTLSIGSGFLVAPDIVATAAHCIYVANEKESKLGSERKNLCFVFGFQMQDGNRLQSPENFEIYEAAYVIDYPSYDVSYRNGNPKGKDTDWALVKLNKPVSNHPIVSIRHTGKVPDKQPLHIIGHPVGLPLKCANNAKVQNNNPTGHPEADKTFFINNLDGFGGNSGSPVFNSQTHVVEGINVAGPSDFKKLRENSKECVRINWRPDSKGLQNCTRTTEFASRLMQSVWSGFKPIPGLIGTENQGGDVAVTDLNGNRKPDLIVFHVQNPEGENKAYYQIGRDLNENGDVTGGWSPFIQVPGRFGHNTEEAGIAVIEKKNGRPDLVVFHIEKTPGGNCGFYRIGCDLKENGEATRWTQPIAMPGRLGTSTQGAGIAVTDLSGNGKPDLIAFFIDNPEGENKGYYRIGRDLDANGKVTGGWSEFLRVPGWFGAHNQGAGIAITDVVGNGRPDLIVFHLDNPAGGNTGYYRIGRDLDAWGNVTGGWNEIKALPGFFGSENQGAGITTAYLNGNTHPHMIVYRIDNPVGGNKGSYRTGWILP